MFYETVRRNGIELQLVMKDFSTPKEIPEKIIEAIRYLEVREENVEKLTEFLKDETILEQLDSNDSSERAIVHIKFADALYEANQISEHEHIFRRCYAVEVLVHERRWLYGRYSDILDPIAEKMNAIEKTYGLDDDEHWAPDDAPESYQALSAQYDKALDKKLAETFVEFGVLDIARLYATDRQRFDELHNVGRKSVHLKEEVERLQELAAVYERNASLSAANGAYLSASIMLCSAIEARLIITCIENEEDVRKTLKKMGLTRKKFKSKNPLDWKLEILIDVCASAGWLPNFETGRFIANGRHIAHILRGTRNYVHPAVQIKQKAGLEFGQRQYRDIEVAYQFISNSLEWSHDNFEPADFSTPK